MILRKTRDIYKNKISLNPQNMFFYVSFYCFPFGASCGENEKLNVTSVVLLQSGKTWNGAVCCERDILPNSSEVKLISNQKIISRNNAYSEVLLVNVFSTCMI